MRKMLDNKILPTNLWYGDEIHAILLSFKAIELPNWSPISPSEG